MEPVGGGCIAHASRVETGDGRFFLKWSAGDAGLTFEAEAAGLRALQDAGSPLLIPEVVAVRDADGTAPGLLLLEWIEPGQRGTAFERALGEGLAALHRHASPDGRYGFERENSIGRLPQPNRWHDGWPAFFRAERLEPQLALARERGRWRPAWTPLADRLLGRLDTLLPADPPASLVHGDLWSGNALAAEPVPAKAGSRVALVDPAAYFGHGETDLAMMELFGGFGAECFAAYRAAWPLEDEAGYPERRDVYQLYHLINHLNHFGSGYAAGVERVLQRYGD